MRVLACLLVTAALGLGAVGQAQAATPVAGKWKATFSTSTGARMSFKVDSKHKRLVHVVVRSYLVFCFETDTSSFDTWTIPSIRVDSHGRFARTYRPDKQSKYVIKGSFTSSKRAKGTALEESAGGTCVGSSSWRGRSSP